MLPHGFILIPIFLVKAVWYVFIAIMPTLLTKTIQGMTERQRIWCLVTITFFACAALVLADYLGVF